MKSALRERERMKGRRSYKEKGCGVGGGPVRPFGTTLIKINRFQAARAFIMAHLPALIICSNGFREYTIYRSAGGGQLKSRDTTESRSVFNEDGFKIEREKILLSAQLLCAREGGGGGELLPNANGCHWIAIKEPARAFHRWGAFTNR